MNKDSINHDSMNHNSKIYVAGHTGLVGSTLFEELKNQNYKNIITREYSDLDLINQQAVFDFFNKERPEYVFLAAAKVGGIYANNTYPAEFIYNNLLISANIIHASYLFKVKKLLYLGSSCIYPKNCLQPIKEEYLLTGELEKTNEPYALSKIAGIKLCQSYNRQYRTKFISCMPTNLYGPNDNFDVNYGHVIPALISKFCLAKKNNEPQVICWGSGNARREFLHVYDLVQALIFLMKNYEDVGENSWINIGTGKDISIYDLAYLIKDLSGFKGEIIFDKTKPDGTQRKLLDVGKINQLGWKYSIELDEGIQEVIRAKFIL